MAERSYPFDSGPGASITEDQWGSMADSWQDDGVEAQGTWDTPLKVTSANEALILHAAPGHANIAGFHYEMDAAKNLTFAANTTGNPRLDRFVLKLDRGTNTISFLYKQGTPAASPIAPPVYKGSDAPEILLATFTVRANSSTVLPAECLDEREFIGKRIRTGEAGFGRGNIHYRPSDDKFYVNRNSVTEALITASTVPATGMIICTSTTRPVTPPNGTVIWETDTLTMRYYQAGAPPTWAFMSGINPYAFRATDNVVPTGTPSVVDSQLQLPLVANASYLVEAHLFANAGDTNWTFGWQLSGTASLRWSSFSGHSGASDIDHTTVSINSFDFASAGAGMLSTAFPCYFTPRMHIRTSTACTLTAVYSPPGGFGMTMCAQSMVKATRLA